MPRRPGSYSTAPDSPYVRYYAGLAASWVSHEYAILGHPLLTAEEVRSEALAEVYESLPRYDTQRGSLRSFIFASALRGGLDYVRRITGRHENSAKRAELRTDRVEWIDRVVPPEKRLPDTALVPFGYQPDVDDLSPVIRRLFQRLDWRTRFIMTRRIKNGALLREIADETDLTEARISQICTATLASFRKKLERYL